MHEYQPQNGPLLLSDSPPPFEENYLCTYELSGLTSRSDDRKRARALAKYQSAAMFVETALSKTAKHWLCTDLALVKLMSNEPPNVESTFHEKGNKVPSSTLITFDLTRTIFRLQNSPRCEEDIDERRNEDSVQ